MKTTHFTKTVLLTFFCAALAACTDASVNQLKGSVPPNGEMTYGELFEQSKDCTGGQWEHRGESGGVLVTYTCNLEPSAALIESVRKGATARVKSLTKYFNDEWQRSLAALQRGKEDAEKTVIQAGTQKQVRITQAQSHLQEAQNKLNQALASSPQQYLGISLKGHTPGVLALGREHRLAYIESTKKEVDIAQQKLLDAEAGMEPDTANRNPGLKQTHSAAEYQELIDGMQSWRSRYDAAVVEAEARELNRAEAYLSAAKDQKLKLSISLLVKKQSVVPVSAKWTNNGKDDGTINLYTDGLLQAPWRMHEILEGVLKSRLSYVVDRNKSYASFPIQCGKEIPTGCELKKPAS